MQSHIVFTFMAPDKPGLLEQMASVVATHHGSWLESRLARLGGQFTGIVRVAVGEQGGAALQADLTAMASEHFQITVHSEATKGSTDGATFRSIDVLGNDRPGIVHELSRTFLKHSINVEELNSEIRSAPMSGDEMFAAELQISMPAEVNSEQFQEELDAVADELDLDIQLK